MINILTVFLLLLTISSSREKKVEKYKYTNKLINEKSPYLLQHAHNPVNWHPWGERAFSKAKREDKPIFLSIGYATCHWCHVMEHESFEDQEVANLLNKAFVSIKVDREERPDIDTIYMTVCQMMTGSGGWPLTIVMTPEKKPFFAATYIPKKTRFGRMGMINLIPKIEDAWKNKRRDILSSAKNITEALNRSHSNNQSTLKPNIVKIVIGQMSHSYDSNFGGFGNAPKFPSSHKLTFLLQNYYYTKNKKTLSMVEKTLKKMRFGGIYDQLGHGFHRYSTDKKWLIPHFEKMLYDQAMLSYTYLEAYQATNNKFYADTAEEIFIYVLRDMLSPENAFYSAEDADSDGVEGKYYVWKIEELQKLLTEKELKLFTTVFNITKDGNYHDEASGKSMKSNILYLNNQLTDQQNYSIELIRKKLFAVRLKRIHPLKDTKILTDWNALMIASFAKAGRVLDSKKYKKVATNAMDFLLTKMLKKENKLMHRYKDGDIAINAKIDDYSFMIYALLELYETTFETKYLENAIKLNDFALKHFWDKNGAFFITSDYDEKLISRPKDAYDGAIPSGNSIFALNLIKLSELTGNIDYLKNAELLINSFSNMINQSPTAFTQMLIAYQFAKKGSYEIVISDDNNSTKTDKIIKAINSLYLPNKVILYKNQDNSKKLAELAKYTEQQKIEKEQTTVYICKGQACEQPLSDIDEIIKKLK